MNSTLIYTLQLQNAKCFHSQICKNVMFCFATWVFTCQQADCFFNIGFNYYWKSNSIKRAPIIEFIVHNNCIQANVHVKNPLCLKNPIVLKKLHFIPYFQNEKIITVLNCLPGTWCGTLTLWWPGRKKRCRNDDANGRTLISSTTRTTSLLKWSTRWKWLLRWGLVYCCVCSRPITQVLK